MASILKQQYPMMFLMMTMMMMVVVVVAGGAAISQGNAFQQYPGQTCCSECHQEFDGCAVACAEDLLTGNIAKCLIKCKAALQTCVAKTPCAGCGLQGCCDICKAADDHCQDYNTGAGVGRDLPCHELANFCTGGCSPATCH